MKGTEIKLGYAPTRRSIFSAPDAIEYRGLTKDRLLELGVPVLLWGPGTSGRTRTACACGTASAACSPQARCCGGSRCPLPI